MKNNAPPTPSLIRLVLFSIHTLFSSLFKDFLVSSKTSHLVPGSIFSIRFNALSITSFFKLLLSIFNISFLDIKSSVESTTPFIFFDCLSIFAAQFAQFKFDI